MPWLRRRANLRRQPTRSGRLPTTYYRSAGRAQGSPFKKTSKSNPRLKRVGWLLINILIIAAIFIGIAYSLIVSSSPNLVLDSTVYHPEAAYRAVAVDKLKSLKNHNKISFNEQSVIRSLKTKFPEIAEASLELPIFSPTPTIRVYISPPSLFLIDSRGTYIIDEEGVAVARADELPKIKNLPSLVDQSGFNVSPGKQVLSASGISFIKLLTAQCAHAGVPIKSLTLPPQIQEIHLRTTDRGYYVKFFLGGDPVRQLGQFLAARHQFDTAGGQPNDYLDVRVVGKVYYK